MIIKKTTIFAASVLSLGIFTSTLSAEDKTSTDIVIATVNGEKIMKKTLDGYLAALNKQGKKTVDKQSAIDDLVATEIAVQEARKSEILERPEIQKLLKDYTRNVLLKTWTKEKVESFKVDEATLKAAYDERVTKLATKEYNARHILVKTEEEAKTIIKDLEGGADFEKLAKEKSTGPSGSNGGSLGWFKSRTMVPAFANAVESMSKGDISKAPVKTQFGYHIIKVEDSRATKLPTMESMKTQLERVIAQKEMLAYMEELKKTADVKMLLKDEPEVTEKAVEETKSEN